MSDSLSESRDWSLYIRDMLEFGKKVLSYTEGMNRDEFVADRRTYDAVMRNIELIGESAARVPGGVRDSYTDIEWRSIIATRNRVAHGYLGIDDDVIWDIVQTDIPDMLRKLHHLLDVEKGESL